MKICEKCGAQLDDNAAFCGVCGASSDPKPVLPDQPFQFSQPQFYQPQQLNQPPQFDQQPQFYQTPKFDQAPQLNNPTQFSQPQFAPQGAAPFNAPVQKGNNKKVMIIIISAIVALVVVVLVLFLFVFKRYSKKDIVGIWQDNWGHYITFNEDGTIDDFGSGEDVTYKLDGDTLTITDNGKSTNYRIAELNNHTMSLKYPSSRDGIKFTKPDPDSVASGYMAQNKLKAANANAKLIYVTLNNTASDLIADGERVEPLNTNEVVPVESFKDSNDPLKKAVYEALKENGEGLGYVYIRYDGYNENDYIPNFVQWSKTEDGDVIGQAPYQPDSKEEDERIRFGTYHH